MCVLLQLIYEVEKKAVLMREQNEEHARLQVAYRDMHLSLETACQEKRSAQAQLLSLKAQARRDARHSR